MEDKAEILSLDNYGNVDTINKKYGSQGKGQIVGGKKIMALSF